MKLIKDVRGLRNNNPGNIERNSLYSWRGEVNSLEDATEEDRFCQFSSFDYGIRAMYRILKTYRDKHFIRTLRDIISRWAPPSENDTESYIEDVWSSMAPHSPFFSDTKELAFSEYPYLVREIIKHENGFCPFTLKYLGNVFEWSVPEW